MTGDVVAAGGIRNADLVEAAAAGADSVAGRGGANDQVRRPREIRSSHSRVEPQPNGIEADIGIDECLVEITHARGQLVSNAIGQNSVIDQ